MLQTDHPLRPPAGVYGARSAVSLDHLAVYVLGSWARHYPPGIPTRLPTLVPYPPWYTLPALAVIVMHSHRDTRYWTPVGEPRGVEHTPVLGSLAGYIQFYEVSRVCTAV